MNRLFEENKFEKIQIPLPEAVLNYYPTFFAEELANNFYEKIYTETHWKHESIVIFNRKILQPRLTALYGNDGKPYGYSGIVMQPQPFSPTLMFIKNEIEQLTNLRFTTVLLNLYRDGNDSMGWHSDNEKELGNNPIIASVSLGATRKFQLKHQTKIEIKKDINLSNGSLLLMEDGFQKHYKHQIPKTKQSVLPRINLTFRTIL